MLDLSNQIPGVDVVGTEAVAGLCLYRLGHLILDIHLGRQTDFDLLHVVVAELPEKVVRLIISGATEPYRAAKLGVRHLFEKQAVYHGCRARCWRHELR